MSKSTLFNAIKNRLIDRVPEIKSFALFNNQFEKESVNNPIQYPACFIEFDAFEWKSQSQGIQIGTVNVRFHIGFETYKTNHSSERIDQPNDIDFLDLIAKVHTSINMFDNELFTPLLRVAETQDTDHDNVMIWVVDYKTQITDDGAEIRHSRPLINLIPDVIPAVDLVITTS